MYIIVYEWVRYCEVKAVHTEKKIIITILIEI